MGRKVGYTPQQIDLMRPGDIRKEYARLKKMANQRIIRLKKAGFGETEMGSKKFIAAKGASLECIAQELADISVFLSDPRSTVKGMKAFDRKIRNTFKKHGYKFKNIESFSGLIDAVGELANRVKEFAYDSYRVAMLQEQAERHNISQKSLKKNFEYFYNNLETLIATPPIERKSGKPVTAANLKQKMERAKWQEAGQMYIEQHGEVWSN